MIAESTMHLKRWSTYSELVALNNEVRYELYDGEVVEMSTPNLLHQKVIGDLLVLLQTWTHKCDRGTVYLSPVDLYVSETRLFSPDLCFFCRERYEQEEIEDAEGRCLVAPPDLIIEVVSASTARNDRGRKIGMYADFGVRHYWLIHPDEKTLWAMVLTDGRYTIETALTDEDLFEPTAFPGLTFALSSLFEQ